jgi:DNA-binding NtrC family response regulator
LASRLLRPAGIEVHHAATLEQANFLLATSGSSVLVTDTVFFDGTWKDANKMLATGHPQVALVVAAEMADERFWIDVLDQGAFDLVVKPFLAGELRRILENANAQVQCGGPLQYGRAAGPN